jgi:hypothetical protein
MSELCIPLDFEQLSELWQLRSALAAKRNKDVSQKQIEQSAVFIIIRLFVTLGYMARSTNEPGFLSSSGALQFLASLEPIFGDDCKVLELLERAKVIEPMEGGWHCPLFARLNAHLTGNFKRPCDNHREHPALPRICGEPRADISLVHRAPIVRDHAADTEGRAQPGRFAGD